MDSRSASNYSSKDSLANEQNEKKAGKISKSSPTEYMTEKEVIETLRSSKDPLDLALLLLENSGNGSAASYPKMLCEAPSVTLMIMLLQEIQKAINDKRLVPITRIDISPDTQRNLFVILTPSGSDKPYIQVAIKHF